jgi:hypothetical protein
MTVNTWTTSSDMYSCDEWVPLSITPQNTTKVGVIDSIVVILQTVIEHDC